LKKTAIVIAGPTGVGKTALSIRLAQYFNTEILSADSRQCFREMNIGVARPNPDELTTVPHHFIAAYSIGDTVNAGVFEQYALHALSGIFSKHNQSIVVGGTGLYIKALCEGMDQIPPVPEAIRTQIGEAYLLKGLTWLQEQLQQKDPGFYAMAEQQNPQRLMRALEVWEATGRSISDFRKGDTVLRDFDCIKIGLDLPRELLYDRINQRVDTMMEAGLLAEVAALLPHRNLNALQTVGYRELFDYTDGKMALAEAVDAIKKHTRHYAKRQLTWFRKDAAMHWFAPDDTNGVIDLLTSKYFLSQRVNE
jgi:tRNA dimethylallyltransferase